MPNPDGETLERRLEAVERAVTDEADSPDSAPTTPATAPDDQLVSRLDALEARVDELDAALQAVRGFLGGVDAVNERVEARADAAVAAVERLEHRLDEADVGPAGRRQNGEEKAATASEPEPASEAAERTLGERLHDRW